MNRMKWLRAPSLALVAISAASSFASAQDTLFSIEGAGAGDRLGGARAVATFPDLDGDGSREIAVGEGFHDGPNGADSGRARLLSGRTGAVIWSWDGEGSSDEFGRVIEDVLDVDGDGIHDIAITAGTYPAGANNGKIYVYSGATGLLLHSWIGENANDFFYFPRGVGDATGDGVNDVIVGAYNYLPDSTGVGYGKVYLYSGADFSLQSSWVGDYFSFFGGRLARLGFDVDGDGCMDFAVGAPENGTPRGPGHVYVYSGKSQTPLVTFVGANAGDAQGYTNDAGDLSGDGIPDLLVGSPSANGALGVVYAYSGADWSLLHTWLGTASMPLGAGFAVADDVDGDGDGDVLLGFTAFDGPGGNDVGRLALHSGATERLLTAWVGDQAGGAFGFPMASAGDFDGDGIPDQLAVSSAFDGAAGADCGKAFVFQGNDLYLNVEPAVASAGDTVTITTTAGVPGNLVIDVLTELDGVPLFQLLTPVTTFDSNGELPLSGSVPPGLGAHDLELRSFAIGRSGRMIDSSTRSLTLQ